MALITLFCLLLSLICGCSLHLVDQSYQEDLLLRHLPDGRISAHFEHLTTWDIEPSQLAHPTQVRHYGMFPRSLAEIIGHYSVQELHLSLTRGKWRTSTWGYPPQPAPPGAEFWVWFLPKTENVDIQWKGVVNAVSGLMCASLNSIDISSTYQPSLSFKPQGALPGNISSSFLRYSALPREAVCTENLTPWSKLLPCGQVAGLGSLYVALKLFNADYHSVSLKVLPMCKDVACSSVRTEIHQALSVVFRPENRAGKINWSLRSLFTKRLSSHCPLATDSSVSVDTTSNIPVGQFTLTPPPSSWHHLKAYGQDIKLAVYNVQSVTSNKSFSDISLSFEAKSTLGLSFLSSLHVRRYVTGSGHERGGIITEIINQDPQLSLLVAVLDMVPWYFRVLSHTLDISCVQLLNDVTINCKDQLVRFSRYTPAIDRLRPYTTEYLFSLPPLSNVTLSVQFLRAFLKWNEFPPDASHGFYINSMVLTTVLPYCVNCGLPLSLIRSEAVYNYSRSLPVRIHSETLLVSHQIPDFSMPYNIICFVSTAVAIGFGSLFNLTTKTLQPVNEDDKKSIISKLRSKIKGLLQKSTAGANEL